MSRSRSVVLPLSLWAATLGAQVAPRSVSPPRAQRPPTLVVFFTVDQLRPDYLDRWRGQFTGGLARLLQGGAVFLNGFQDHANTETAPGHAATLSGRFPRSTGIVSNTRGVYDDQSPPIGGGTTPASPFRFRGGTLIDWMRIRDERSRALSVSRKDRGAILPLGRAHQPAYWYAVDTRFTTSTYYADTLPTWVRRFNARGIPLQYAGKQWVPLLPDSAYPEADSVPAENGGRDFMFPHTLPLDQATAARAFPEFPWMDQMTLDFALLGLRQLDLGRGPATDLLAISLSTTDAIGHRYGPDSRELHDQVIRLDRMLGVFLDSLFQVRDSSTVLIALTADHGVQSFPQLYTARTGEPAFRVDLGDITEQFYRALVARGVDSAAFAFEDGILWMDRGAFGRAGVKADSVIDAFGARARAVAGVLTTHKRSQLTPRDTLRNVVVRRWYHALPPDAPFELVVTLRPHSVWTNLPFAMHGTPDDLDAKVPIIFYGAPFKPGRYTEVARVVDMAPTLAQLLGVQPGEPLDGHVLRAILR